jgi:hypothetical protein
MPSRPTGLRFRVTCTSPSLQMARASFRTEREFLPNRKLKWDQDNPTGHGTIFIGVGGQVYCCVTPVGVRSMYLRSQLKVLSNTILHEPTS